MARDEKSGSGSDKLTSVELDAGRTAEVKTSISTAKRKTPFVKRITFERTHPSYIPLSVIVTVVFNLPFGLLALIFAKSAEKKFASGEMRSANKRAHLSLVLNLAGMSITVLIVAFVVYFR